MHTAAGTAIPGATVRVIETSSGKSWLTWSDENGKFVLPPLAPGHYRIEASQLGFGAFSKEFDLAANPAAIDLPLAIDTLAEIDAANSAVSSAAAAGMAAPNGGSAAGAAKTGTTNAPSSAAAGSGVTPAPAAGAPNPASQSTSGSTPQSAANSSANNSAGAQT
ncbi:MAG: carboxypeptidase-like regulatory domain-containing protein, partial [Candidatus Acidiferrales bacterium]